MLLFHASVSESPCSSPPPRNSCDELTDEPTCKCPLMSCTDDHCCMYIGYSHTDIDEIFTRNEMRCR